MLTDRNSAGKLLAQKLSKYSSISVVIAIPRGGVVVGIQIAEILHKPCQIIVVKKIGSPYNPELAIGAVAPESTFYIDKEILKQTQVDNNMLGKLIEIKKKEVSLRQKAYQVQEIINLDGKRVMLVDDGIATGATIEAAIMYLKNKKVSSIVVAVPVLSYESYKLLKEKVDQIVYLEMPERFISVGANFGHFPQVTDEQVIEILSNTKNLL